jgi:steroid delta-isomerase
VRHPQTSGILTLMLTREDILATIENYLDAVGRHDLDAVVDLFAEDAVQEDPIGTPPNVGRPAIREFFEKSFAAPFSTELAGPPLVTGAYAAFQFTIAVETGGDPFLVRAIDVMHFDATGKIDEVRAVVD